jgi:hypothetical protein
MIAEIRQYFNERITEVDPLIKELETDLFGNNDESLPQAEKYYNLILGAISSTRNGNSHSDTMNVQLDIYGNAKRDTYSAFADLYEKAWEVKKQVICPVHLYQTLISDIESTGLEPIELIDNDKAIKIRITFNVRIDYGF